jgi:hypothetical protein
MSWAMARPEKVTAAAATARPQKLLFMRKPLVFGIDAADCKKAL